MALQTAVYAYRRPICIIYIPNSGFTIVVPGRDSEQGRFRGSSKGAGGGSKSRGAAAWYPAIAGQVLQ